MSIDPGSASAAAAAMGVAAKVTEKVAGPALEEIGEPLRLIARRLLRPVVERLEKGEEADEALIARTMGILRDRGVPEDRLKEPAEVILANALMGNRFSGGQDEICDLFAGLLATEMDGQGEQAHPAYAEIIRQLSPYDAKVLRLLFGSSPVGPLARGQVRSTYLDGTVDTRNLFSPPPSWEHVLGSSQDALLLSLSNLERLQLAQVTVRKPADHYLKLMPYGASFCRACMIAPTEREPA